MGTFFETQCIFGKVYLSRYNKQCFFSYAGRNQRLHEENKTSLRIGYTICRISTFEKNFLLSATWLTLMLCCMWRISWIRRDSVNPRSSGSPFTWPKDLNRSFFRAKIFGMSSWENYENLYANLRILEHSDCKKSFYAYPTLLLMSCFVTQLLSPVLDKLLLKSNLLQLLVTFFQK